MDALLAQLPPDTTVVTANRRLARNLLRAHDARRRTELGDTAWESPDILPWNAWLARLWEGLMGVDAHPAVVLDPVQEQAVWEQVIGAARDALPGGALLQVPQAARLTAEAWRLLHGWRIPLAGHDPLNDDGRAFSDWAGRYQARCAHEGWVDAARLPDLLARRLAQAPWLLPRRLLLAGFDELTPQQGAFLEQLGSLGTERVETRAEEAPGHCVRHAFTDAEAEAEACAAWVRACLERQPEARIGVVVPDLAGQRTRIARCFDDALRPGALLPGAGADPRPFNLSLGAPLLDQPLVSAALGVLELLRGPQPLERVGQLLRSPYLGEPEELPARALLDARLREDGELTVTLRRLLGLAGSVDAEGRPRPWSSPALAASLARAREASRRETPPRTAGGWAEHFSRLLELAGWPGERALDSAEYQVLGAWRGLLERFAAVELVEQRQLGPGAAMARLRRLAAESAFQPEGDTAPVQVLGVLESGGARFDALWVLGLHDEAWPAPVRPNPFLPYGLQRRLGLPRASAERELAYAARTLDRLRASAPEIVLSSPRLDGDRELRPSPLIAALPETPFPAPAAPRLVAHIRGAARLEPVAEPA
ncbi:MAG: PD-(D/E)XK nuclease family protein, partial [Gammaproteobacteria bacterium]|nr:PD-(D/E)XK nuclease family protein [Gammaproteobacteria bacterium]